MNSVRATVFPEKQKALFTKLRRALSICFILLLKLLSIENYLGDRDDASSSSTNTRPQCSQAIMFFLAEISILI